MEELTVWKLCAAAFLLTLSACFGLGIPYLVWRSRRRNVGRCHDDRHVDEIEYAGQRSEQGASCCSTCLTKLSRYDALSAINCACGGLFLAVSLLDLVPEARAGVDGVLAAAHVTTDFACAEFLIGAALLLVMIVENLAMTTCVRSNTSDDERRPLLHDRATTGDDPPREDRSAEATRALVLIATISVHSVFEGLALGLERTTSELLQLLLAIAVHKSVLAFALGVRLFDTFGGSRVAVACSLLFCAASPLGALIGVAVADFDDGGASPVAVAGALLQCVAAGTFVYVTFVEVVPQEFAHYHATDEDDYVVARDLRRSRPRMIPRAVKLLLLCAGFAFVAGLKLIPALNS